MKKQMKQMLVLLGVLLLLKGSSVYATENQNVYDDAGLLTEGEITLLNESIAKLQDASGWNVYAVTTDDAQGKSAVAYADDFFDTHSTEQEDGVVALIDMDNREIYLSTGGEAIRYLTDDRIDAVLDDAYDYISDEEYGSCLEAMVIGVDSYYNQGIPAGQYNYNEETGEISRYRSITVMEAGIALLVAVAAGVAVILIIIGKYQLHFGTYKYPFHDFGEVNLKVSEDRFVNQTVTQRRIPKETTSSGGGGRSSVHTSSGGHSHGGGGRSF